MNKSNKLFSHIVLTFILMFVIVVIDQFIKIEVKTNMHLGDSIHVTDWFYITFIENNGMAYGMTFINKVFLTSMRLVAVVFLIWYMLKLVSMKHRLSYLLCLALITAGAAGNIFDCVFYGQIFTASSPFYISEFTDFGSGYAPLLQGKVVDMFYFPLIVTTWPEWVPLKGGEEFIFFSPIFNFADACISVGVVIMLLFFRHDLESLSEVFHFKKPDIGKLKNILLLCILMGLVVSCKPGVPSKYIQPSKMEDILYDYHIADGMALLSDTDTTCLVSYHEAVFCKYDITKADFDSSMVYYMRHADLLHSIYQKLSDRMGIEAAGLGSTSNNRIALTSTGDTANVWTGDRSIVLSTIKPSNLYSFKFDADTAYHAGDRIMLNFDAQFLFQDGVRDGFGVLVVEFKNDSVATQNIHVASSTHYSMDIIDDQRLGIKQIRGFFLLNGNLGASQNQSTLKLMFVQNIQLIRMHAKKESKSKSSSIPNDSTSSERSEDGDAIAGKEIRLEK